MWVRVEGTDDARAQLQNRLRRDFDIPLRVGMRTRTAPGRAELIVHYPNLNSEVLEIEDGPTSYVEVAKSLPKSVTGVAGRGTDHSALMEEIPVRIKKSSPSYQTANHYNNQYRPVPAGAAFTMLEGDPDTYCTTGTPASQGTNGDPVLVTAAHCFVLTDSDDYWQYEPSGTRHGAQIDGLWANDFDACLVSPNTFDDVEYDFAAEDSTSYRGVSIKGTRSRSGIIDMHDSGEYLEIQGATTGVHNGQIVEVSDREFATDLDTQDGDSGSPVYDLRYSHRIGYYSYIAGIHSRVDENDDNIVWHTLMESIEDELNVTV